LVHNGSDLIGIIDIDCNYLYVAESVKHILGFDPEFLENKNAFDFIHPDDHESIRASLMEVSHKRYFAVKPFRFKDSAENWRWVETNIANYLDSPAINGLIVNSRDITERKKAEAELALNEHKFKSVVQNGSDIIVIMEADGIFKYVSDNVLSILGYVPSSLIHVNAFDLIHHEDKKGVFDELNRVISNDPDAKGILHRFLKTNGEWLWLESKGTNHLDNPSISGIVINSRDVSERIMLQKKLDQELINKQKEITAAVIKAQEDERSQLGLELHDNVNQVLTTIKLYNEMYLTGFHEDKELLKKSTQYLQDCINEIRSISKRLSAPTLGNINLVDSMNELVESINLTNRLEIQYIHENICNVYIKQDMHLAIYRIVQEGLNNIIKYAQASHAIIKISISGNKLCVLIQDNGRGFDLNKKREGIGITNMRTRAENLNGTFNLKSALHEGCSIEICFPFNNDLQ
jgi:PAS domain S-box-containing protein